MRAVVYLLRILSVLLLGLGILAVPFALVYLMGAIGTGGREAVGELVVMLTAVAVGFGGGVGVWRAAGVLNRRRT